MKKPKRVDINYEYHKNNYIFLDLLKHKIIINNSNVSLEMNEKTIISATYDVIQKDLIRLINTEKYSKIILDMEKLYIYPCNDEFRINLDIYKQITCKSIDKMEERVINIIQQYYSNEQLINKNFTNDDLKEMLLKGLYTKEDYENIEEQCDIKLKNERVGLDYKLEEEEDVII